MRLFPGILTVALFIASLTAAGAEPRRPNHLAGSTSPHLQQHLYNPVDW